MPPGICQARVLLSDLLCGFRLCAYELEQPFGPGVHCLYLDEVY